MFQRASETSGIVCKSCGNSHSYLIFAKGTATYLYCGECHKFIQFVSKDAILMLRQCGCILDGIRPTDERVMKTKSGDVAMLPTCQVCGSNKVVVTSKSGVNVVRCSDCNTYMKNVSDATVESLKRVGRLVEVNEKLSEVPFDLELEPIKRSARLRTPVRSSVPYLDEERDFSFDHSPVGYSDPEEFDKPIFDSDCEQDSIMVDDTENSCEFCEGTLALEDKETHVKLLIQQQRTSLGMEKLLEVVDSTGTVIGEFRLKHCPFCTGDLASGGRR